MCLYYSDDNGNITEKMLAFFRKRAASGIGAFIIPANPHGGNKRSRGSLADDSRIDQWKPLIETIHGYGAKVFCQIHPATIQFGRKDFNKSPFDLSVESLEQLIESYAQGALRAKKAGFDGVEIHGAHGHEIALLLSELLNTRTDKYGGSLENCARTVTDMIRRMKELCSTDFPVILRVSGEERIPGGREIERTAELCMLVRDAGADAIHVSAGMPQSEEWECPPSEVEQGHLRRMSRYLKDVLDIPVIVVGRIVDWRIAEQIIGDGDADFVALARGILSDGDWMRSVGQAEDYPIRRCIGCNQGCRTRREQTKTFCACLQNPMTGREELVEIRRDAEGRKVCVIGAGVAGLEAANVLSQRGCEVTVYEKTPDIGGLFYWAGKAPGKDEYINVIRYYERVLKERGVRFMMNAELSETPAGDWDLVVVATGAQTRCPPISSEDIVFKGAVEILQEANLSSGAYVVVGDGLVGYEVADFISSRGKKVILVGNEPRDPDALQGIARWHFMKQRFAENDVAVLRHNTVQEVSSSGFRMIDKNGAERFVEGAFDYVMACGYLSNPDAVAQFMSEGQKVLVVGSAGNCGDAMDAIHDAFDKALLVDFQ